MSAQRIYRGDLQRQLQRTAQYKAIVCMLSAVGVLVGAALLQPLLVPWVGLEVLQWATVISFFGSFFGLESLLNAFYCPQRVLCPNCQGSLWSCATRNRKPRRIKIRPDVHACPHCGTPIV